MSFLARTIRLSRRSISNIGLQTRLISGSQISFGGHGHAPDLPPFGRLAPPTGKLAEEIELVWDDTVAPETAIDIDAPHVSTNEVLMAFAAAFAFFGTLYTLISISDPVGSNPVAVRATVIPFDNKVWLGQDSGAVEEEEEEEE